MDELWGKPGNGEIIGNYDLTGTTWQKWNFKKHSVCGRLYANRVTFDLNCSNLLTTRMAATLSWFNSPKDVYAKSQMAKLRNGFATAKMHHKDSKSWKIHAEGVSSFALNYFPKV